jgi:hypothetical protein
MLKKSFVGLQEDRRVKLSLCVTTLLSYFLTVVDW